MGNQRTVQRRIQQNASRRATETSWRRKQARSGPAASYDSKRQRRGADQRRQAYPTSHASQRKQRAGERATHRTLPPARRPSERAIGVTWTCYITHAKQPQQQRQRSVSQSQSSQHKVQSDNTLLQHSYQIIKSSATTRICRSANLRPALRERTRRRSAQTKTNRARRRTRTRRRRER